MDKKKVKQTPLAQWLNLKMSERVDPVTGQRGISGNGLARGAGLPQSLVWGILKSGVIPKADILIRLAEFFGTSPVLLFRLAYLEGEEDKFSPEVQARLVEIEDILADVPAEAQLHLLQSLITQAQMLKIAAESWQKEPVSG